MVVPSGICTSRSMMALRTRQWRPTFTCENKMLASTSLKELTRTSGDSTLFFTVPPETMQPAETIESSAEPGRHADDVHVGLVVGLERTYIAPVQGFFLVLVHEVERVHPVVIHHPGQKILAEVMARLRRLGVFEQYRNKHVRVEDVD